MATMTTDRLHSLYCAEKEISTLIQRADEMRARASRMTRSMSDTPIKSDHNPKSAENYILSAVILEETILEKAAECATEEKECLNWISTIPDSRIRQIIYLRYCCGKTWIQIAMSMGRDETEDSVRKAASRYISRYTD